MSNRYEIVSNRYEIVKCPSFLVIAPQVKEKGLFVFDIQKKYLVSLW